MININAEPKPSYELTEEELDKATGGREGPRAPDQPDRDHQGCGQPIAQPAREGCAAANSESRVSPRYGLVENRHCTTQLTRLARDLRKHRQDHDLRRELQAGTASRDRQGPLGLLRRR